MRTVVLSLFCVLASAVGFASDEKDPRVEAMKAVPDLTGKWEGGGWIRRGPAEPIKFVGEETVEARLGGRVLVIEGKHFTPDRSETVHHALAVLSFDSKAGAYRFDTWLFNGDGGNHPAKVEDGALVWERPHPEYPARFIIRVKDDRWHEIGELRMGGTWRQFFEMELKRVK